MEERQETAPLLQASCSYSEFLFLVFALAEPVPKRRFVFLTFGHTAKWHGKLPVLSLADGIGNPSSSLQRDDSVALRLWRQALVKLGMARLTLLVS